MYFSFRIYLNIYESYLLIAVHQSLEEAHDATAIAKLVSIATIAASVTDTSVSTERNGSTVQHGIEVHSTTLAGNVPKINYPFFL
jgi:uncharacterized protein with ACT and thioredoxin-like domain